MSTGPSDVPSNPTAGTPAVGRLRALADLGTSLSGSIAIEDRQTLSAQSVDALVINLMDQEERDFGNYELLELIGKGGMGVVYRALQRNLNREVAIKLLVDDIWEGAQHAEQLRNEARAAARLQHPNIVDIYDVGNFGGISFIAMRLVRGKSLSLHEKMYIEDAVLVVRKIAIAIDYAHRLNVLHLDLKPGNILMSKDNEPLIADFGLARYHEEGRWSTEHEISGTPGYMSPEQACPGIHPVGRASDVYGLGAVLYELLKGQPPFVGTSVETILDQVLHSPAPSPISLNTLNKATDKAIAKALGWGTFLNAICLKCLAKNPNERYGTALELADDLGRYLDGDVPLAMSWNVPRRLFVSVFVGSKKFVSVVCFVLLALAFMWHLVLKSH